MQGRIPEKCVVDGETKGPLSDALFACSRIFVEAVVHRFSHVHSTALPLIEEYDLLGYKSMMGGGKFSFLGSSMMPWMVCFPNATNGRLVALIRPTGARGGRGANTP